ncbi:coth protein-domain-containing protein [Chlamydoabsidia padenii]|nr:coth protein-domain-containing protein [Chlamydoabsidia padenii]
MKNNPDQSTLLYHVDIPTDAAEIKYRYVLLEPDTKTVLSTELFHRTLSKQGTLNEFYGRETTVYDDIKTFPDAEDRDLLPVGFDRAPTTLHRTNEIVTLHITAPPDQVEQMHNNYKEDITIQATLTYISSDNVRTFEDCSFSVGGRSSRRFTKLPYKFNLGKKDNLGGYHKFKLRTTASDPSYLREKLSYDLHSAAGRPISKSSHVRLFINDQAIGLFLLAERYDKTWLKNEFSHGDTSADIGTLFESQGALVKEKKYADLSYYSEDLEIYTSLYDIEEGAKKKKDLSDLMDLIEFIHEQLEWQETQNNDSEALDGSMKLWESKLNVKGTLTNLALEFLLGTWDNYVQNAQNYYLYKQPQEQPFDWLAWDFDFSLGNGPVRMDCLVTGDYHNFTGMMTRPLTKALLAIPTYRDRFEANLKYISNHLLTPSVSFPLIDQWIGMLKLDILWDQTLPRVRSGKSYGEMIHMAGGGGEGEGEKMSLPEDFSISVGMDFISRVNNNVSLNEAIEGPSTHDSLIPLKVFIQQKTDGIIKVLGSS